MIHFGTEKVQNVDFADLKLKLEGPSLLSRIAYRQANSMQKKRQVVAKG